MFKETESFTTPAPVAPVVTPVVDNVFARAAEIIEKRGHAKNEFCDQWGAVCLFGALNAAHHGVAHTIVGCEPGIYVDWAVNLGFADPRAVTDWNDAPERTSAEVIARLRLASEQANG